MSSLTKLLTVLTLVVCSLPAHTFSLSHSDKAHSLYRYDDVDSQNELTLNLFPYFSASTSAISGCHSHYHTFTQHYQASVQCDPSSASSSMNEHSRYYNLAMETRNIGIMSLVAMMIIFALPEDVSNWERSEMKPKKLADKWIHNNRDGPVWDKDDWVLNYIGHPYFGAVYYVVARNQGFGPTGSFTYSFLMSTFLWEFGLEALAEVPSKQDILITPIIGSILGEAFYIWEQRLLENDGILFGSSTLGSTALFLVNPAGHLSQVINRILDHGEVLQEPQTNWVIRANEWTPERSPHWAGIEMSFKF